MSPGRPQRITSTSRMFECLADTGADQNDLVAGKEHSWIPETGPSRGRYDALGRCHAINDRFPEMVVPGLHQPRGPEDEIPQGPQRGD